MAFKIEAAAPRTEGDEDDLNDLVSALGKAEIKEDTSQAINASDSATKKPELKKPIPEHITGKKVVEYDFIEIKTMAQKKEINWKEFYPQLMLSNNRSLYAARHFRGQFITIDKFYVGDPSLKAYEEDTRKAFGQLLEFLRRLFVTLKQSQSGAGPWALVCMGGNLKLHKLEKDVLSPEEISRFS
jgi:hypothetical protein